MIIPIFPKIRIKQLGPIFFSCFDIFDILDCSDIFSYLDILDFRDIRDIRVDYEINFDLTCLLQLKNITFDDLQTKTARLYSCI